MLLPVQTEPPHEPSVLQQRTAAGIVVATQDVPITTLLEPGHASDKAAYGGSGGDGDGGGGGDGGEGGFGDGGGGDHWPRTHGLAARIRAMREGARGLIGSARLGLYLWTAGIVGATAA